MGSTGYLVYGRGLYTFLNLSTSSAVGTAGGNAFASFLYRRAVSGSARRVSARPGRPDFRPLWVLCAGRFKLTPRLTVNIGARYDIMPYPREMHDRLSNFDPATGTMLIAGVTPSRRLVNTDYKDVAPRIGLAWVPWKGRRTVVRAGYGIGFVDPYGGAGMLNSNEFNVPFYYVNNVTLFPFSAADLYAQRRLPAW